MTPYEFRMASEGFFNDRVSLYRQVRNAAAVMYHTMGGKGRIEQYWPLPDDKDNEPVSIVWGENEEEAKKRMEEILAYHNVKLPK